MNPREQGRHDEHRHAVDPVRYETDAQYRHGVQQQRGTEGGAFSSSGSGCLPLLAAWAVVGLSAVYVVAQLVRAVTG